MSELSRSLEYVSFRSSIPLRRISVDSRKNQVWNVYDSGPKTVKSPLVCLPPACGTADVYFKQVLGLSAKGFRVISAEHPAYWSVDEWCSGFKKLIDILELDKIHLFGASLGGFLAQKFAEYTENFPRVASLILCNTFFDTSVFQYNEKSQLFWVLPSMVLKKMIMVHLPVTHTDKRIIDSIDFMVERLDSLSQQDLASRLTINCINSSINPDQLEYLDAVTVIDVFDECAISTHVREMLNKCYPNAKLAHLKAGGNFPYLSRSDEVNLHLQIHLRQFDESDVKARES